MKEINHRYTFDPSLTSSLQRLDGYYPVIFFDYGDYVSKLCPDGNSSGTIQRTAQSYGAIQKKYRIFLFDEQRRSENQYLLRYYNLRSKYALAGLKKEETAWYAATH